MLNKTIGDRKNDLTLGFLGNVQILLLDQAKLLEYIGSDQI
jgi:hypothetical protein